MELPKGFGRGRASVLVVFLAVLAVVAAAGVLVHDRSRPAQPHGGLAAGDFPEPGVIHVHGLGLDPADGTLYAATHSGLFVLPDHGKAVRVANRYQDTMGFTVTGPRTFLGSGHPDLREDLPVRLGLIQSTDAGQSWVPLSLQGKADFHVLQAAHGNVYGYDSTSETFMVSNDRLHWAARSKQLLRDFAVSPRSADTVVATIGEVVLLSADGGGSWHPLIGAPALVVLAWPSASSLYGVTRDGTVRHSSDGGTTWTVRGRVGGEPEAMTVGSAGTNETMYVAVAGRGILVSSNGGRTFTTRYSE